MQIKSEYINPSDKLKVILLKGNYGILDFSKFIERDFNVLSKQNKGNWNGLIMEFQIDGFRIILDDIYDGDLRVLVDSNEDFYKSIVNWIRRLSEEKS